MAADRASEGGGGTNPEFLTPHGRCIQTIKVVAICFCIAPTDAVRRRAAFGVILIVQSFESLKHSQKHDFTSVGGQLLSKPPYRGNSLIINTSLIGPYSRPIPRVLWWSSGGGAFS